MSRENVELVRAAMERFLATGEPDWSVHHVDVEVHDHDIPDAGEYRGHAGVRRWLFEDWTAAWSEFSLEPKEYIDAGERVVAVFRLKAIGRRSGVAVDRLDAIVVEMRDGMFVRYDYYNDRGQALQAAGLAGDGS
jgi:ketosteroid isomerase-like protein